VPGKIVYIGLGANIGNRTQNLKKALLLLDEHPEIEVVACSRLYETEPVQMDSPHWFMNAVARINTSLAPEDLMTILLETEKRLGRDRGAMDRTVDLDILYMQDTLWNDGSLVIPHPRLQERAFVLRPWMDLDPDLVIEPLGKTVSELCSSVSKDSPVVRVTQIAIWEDRA